VSLTFPRRAADRWSVNGTASADTISGASEAPQGKVAPTGAGGSGFLSDVIVELGFASREAVEQAVRAARSPGTTVARVLIDTGAITEEQLARATAERYGIDYVDLSGFEVDPAAANLIKPAAARRYQAVPVAYAGKALLVAMADPADALGVNDIAAMTRLEVRPAVAAPPALEALLEALPLEADGLQNGGSAGDEPDVDAERGDGNAGDGDAGPNEVLEGAILLRDEGDELRSELRQAAAEAEAHRKELELVRAKLTSAETELARARADADARGAELEAMRARAESAEREAADATRLTDELAAADERAEQARQALTETREEAERERERAAMTERELREKLSEEEGRRGELESRLAEVEAAALAAEQAFEELRLAQGRVRGALQAPDGSDAQDQSA
jgi:Type II secretion system (T2SS), protein E, N-terminal domain